MSFSSQFPDLFSQIRCPISKQIMTDPIRLHCRYSHVFDRKSIEDGTRETNECPLCHDVIYSDFFTSNQGIQLIKAGGKLVPTENCLDVDMEPLYLAIEKKDAVAVKNLFRFGRAVTKSTLGNNKRRASPLHYAVMTGNISIVKLLLDAGALLEEKIQDIGCTPLITAAGKTNALHMITSDGTERPLLEFLPYCDHDLTEIIELLLERGASCFAKDNKGRTALHKACLSGIGKHASRLLQAEASIIKKYDNDGMTPLMLAMKNGNEECIQILLRSGADIRAKNFQEVSLLHLAAENGNIPWIETLLQQGFSIHSTTKDGFTPLHYAAKAGKIDVIRALLSHGAQIYSRINEIGTIFHIGAQKDNVQLMKDILALGFDINIGNQNQETALHAAIRCKNKKAARFLIEQGANIEAKASVMLEKKGYEIGVYTRRITEIGEPRLEHQITPLHLAVIYKEYEIIDLLLNRGANASARSSRGRTPYGDRNMINDVDLRQRLFTTGCCCVIS